MIAIKIDNEFLELDDRTTLKITRKGNILEPEIQGSLYTQAFTIMASPKNRRLLGHRGALDDAATGKQYFDAELWLAGNQEVIGKLYIDRFGSDTFRCSFQGEFGQLSPDIAGKSLREIDLGGELLLPENTAYYLYQCVFDNTETDYTINIDGDDHTAKGSSRALTIAALVDEINAGNAGRAIDGGYEDLGAAPDGDYFILIKSPADYDVGSLSITMDTNLGATLAMSWTNDVLVVGDASIMEQHLQAFYEDSDRYERIFGDRPYHFPMVYNPDFFTTEFNTYENIMNIVDTAASIGNAQFLERLATGLTSDFPEGSGAMACPEVLYLLRQILAEGGLEAGGEVMEDSELAELIFIGNYDQHFQSEDDPTDGNFFSGTVDLSKSLPDVEAGIFLNEFKKLFCIGFFYDLKKGQVRLRFLKDILADSETTDWTDKVIADSILVSPNEIDGIELEFNRDTSDQAIADKFKDLDNLNIEDPVDDVASLPNSSTNRQGDVRLVRELVQYYVWNEASSSWSWYSDAQHKKTVGELTGQILEISTTLCPTIMISNPEWDTLGPTELEALMPHVQVAGNSPRPNYAEGFNSPGMKVAFYRGLQTDGSGNDYPLASPFTYDYNGNQISGANYAIRWDEDQGLYENFWKEWCTWRLATRPVKARAALTVQDFFGQRMDKKIRIQNRNLLIDEMSITIRMTGIGFTELKLQTV